jgi:hypothetical protein
MHATKTPAPRSKAGCGCGTCASCTARSTAPSPMPERSSVAPASTVKDGGGFAGARDDRSQTSPFGFSSNGRPRIERSFRMRTTPGSSGPQTSVVSPDGPDDGPTTTKDAGADGGTPAPSFCQCTPTSAEIKNIKKTSSGKLYGHEFDFVVGLTYAKAASGATASTDCTLEWWEKTDSPPAWQTAITANTWNDMFKLYPTSPTFDGWTKNRTKPCPGSETATIHDTPANLTDLPSRTLEFNLKAIGGGVTKSATAKQVLEPDGRGGITKQDFTAP